MLREGIKALNKRKAGNIDAEGVQGGAETVPPRATPKGF